MSGNVRIHSDGTARGTKVYTASGAEIKGVRSLAFEVDYRNPLATARVELLAVAHDVGARPEVLITDPRDGRMRRVQRVEFADGTAWSVTKLADGPYGSPVMGTLAAIVFLALACWRWYRAGRPDGGLHAGM